MDFKEVTMFQAPDGSMYATKAEAETYAVRKAAELVLASDIHTLVNTTADPHSNVAMADALWLLANKITEAPPPAPVPAPVPAADATLAQPTVQAETPPGSQPL